MKKEEIRSRLFDMQDIEFKKFQCKLIPGVNSDTVIGVRTPLLRKLAKEIFKSDDYEEFIRDLPHEYYEEVNLHGMIICMVSDYDEAIHEVNKLLPYVDNWATCDLLSCKKAFKDNLDKLETDVKRWISSGDTYTVRFGIGVLLEFYLDDAFDLKYLEWVARVESDEYYIRMMKAWYFATALAKQYDEAIPYIENHRLEEWVHRKTIQKAKESFRVSDDTKAYLNTLK
ncbi:DNA alkylation repair protein [Mogibacterium neglectum]|uniref:DNA alkylation repair protein n=1 Tax=Mogibacterium neglectum TaxID=114528 RepID=UPI00272BD7B3|nr:DNA alkylation repair protein [Mogibacterium neglectum]WLD75604.1 DNA alkylation repair protein [Mogibacterium neglectum]